MKNSICLIVLIALTMFARAANFDLENFDYDRYNAERQRSYEQIPLANLDSLMSRYLEKGTRTTFCFATPSIGDQGNLNSCVLWALCYAGVSIRLYNYWTADWNVSLCSPAFLFNQYKILPDPTDCHSAYSATIGAMADSLKKYGVCTYAMMPYDSTDCTTMPTIPQRINAMNKKFFPARYTTTNSVSIFKAIIDVLESPIIVGMPMYSSFVSMWNDTTQHGIWNNVDTTSYAPTLWHATCIVGYDDSKEAFKVMNSWGDSLGDHGFYWAKYSVVEQGAFREAIALSTRDSARIEGPYTMTDTTAWYHIRNVPAGATITWSINNHSAHTFEFVTASPQNRDSMRVAFRQIPANPGHPINGNSEIDGLKPLYQQADLTITVSSGGQSYSMTKNIRREIYSSPFMLRDTNSNDHKPEIIVQGDYVQITKINDASTIEVWNAMHGRVLTQRAAGDTEQIDIHNLPKGIYVVILKEEESIVAETKVLIP